MSTVAPVAHQCPRDSVLLEFAAGLLAPRQVEAVDEHLDGCAECRVIVGGAGLRTGGVAEVFTPLDGGRAGRLERGDPICRYRVVEVLGAGAMGVVYAARDPVLERPVAIKVLHRASPDGGPERRLVREAQALARLSHPNVVQVYDAGDAEGRVFIAMELVEGMTLQQWLSRRSRSVPEVLAAFVAAARGLSAAHEVGIVHRDFKPENVLVGRDGRVRVSDFGLALDTADTSSVSLTPRGTGPGRTTIHRLTRTGWTMGTPAYMSPEQHAGRQTTAASDQFALCVALYEALYGERPFHGATHRDLAAAVRRGEFEIPRRRGVPTAVERALERGLSVDPARRFPTVMALAAVLRPWPPRRRRRVLVGAGVLATATGGLAMQARPEAACEQTGAELTDAWSEATGQRMHAAFVASGAPWGADAAAHTIARLDHYAQEWIDTRRSVCEDARADRLDDHARAATVACLRTRAHALATTVGVLSSGEEAVVERAPQVVAELESPTTCRSEPARTAATAALRDPEIARLQPIVDEAIVLRRAGRPQAAHALLERHRAAIDALDEGPLRVRELLSRGMIYDDLRDAEAAISTLTAAHWMALDLDQPPVAAAAALRLAAIYARDLTGPEAARAWLYEGQLAARLSHDPGLAVAALHVEANLHRAEGEHPQARARYEDALALLQREDTPDPIAEAGVWMMLGGESRTLHEYPRAEVELQRALQIYREAVGPLHPRLTGAYTALADTARARGDRTAARAFLDAGLAIERQRGNPDGTSIAASLYQRGMLESEDGNRRRAIEIFDEAIALYEEAGSEATAVAPRISMAMAQLELGELPAAHANLLLALQTELALGSRARTTEALVLHDLGEVESAMGRLADARKRYTMALALWEAALGPDATTLSFPLTGLGELELAEGNPAGARALLERALALSNPMAAERDELGETSLALARALWADPDATPQDRARAVSLARTAAEAFAELGAVESERRDEAERWAQAHDRLLDATAGGRSRRIIGG